MTKLEEADNLRKKILSLKDELKKNEKALVVIEDSCRHVWLKAEYIPEYHEGYTIPGDPPGTMGVDRQFPCYVPAKTIKKWRRKCGQCGTTQITTRIKKVSSDEPEF